jgi:hypothetical protein
MISKHHQSVFFHLSCVKFHVLTPSEFQQYTRWAVQSYLSSGALSGTGKTEELRLILLPGVSSYLGPTGADGLKSVHDSIAKVQTERLGRIYGTVSAIEIPPESRLKLDALVGRPAEIEKDTAWGLKPLKSQAAFASRRRESIPELPDVEHAHSTVQFVCSPEFPLDPQLRKSLGDFCAILTTQYYESLLQSVDSTPNTEEKRQKLILSKSSQMKSASAELKRVLDREQMILVKQWYFRNQLNRGLGHFFSHQLVREYLGDDLPKGPEFTIALQKAAQAELAATTKAYREIFVKFVRQLDDHGRKQLGKLIDLPKI